jgi:hypothetical protein
MGTGGTRYGAGRPALKAKAEHCRSVDVRRFAAENMLRAGAWTWQWRDPDTAEVRSSITVYGRSDSIALAFTIEGASYRNELPVIRTECNFGGSRPWFACPCCGRRVARVFLRFRRFACRHCQRVSYASQSDDAMGRAWRAQTKLEAKLDPHWRRPRYMHHATRARLMAKIMELEQRRDDALAAFMGTRFPGLLPW